MAAKPETSLRYADGCPDCGRRETSLPKTLAEVGDDFDWQLRDYDGFRLFMLQELAARFPERTRWTPADVEVATVEVISAILDQLSDTLDRVSAEAFLETARQPASVRRLLSMIGYDVLAKSAENAGVPDGMAGDGETHAQRRARLMGFCVSLHAYLTDYQGIINALGTEAAIQTFMRDPETADAISMQSLQDFLDAAPAFVLRAQQDALDSYWLIHPREMNRHRLAGPRAIHHQQRMVTPQDYANRLQEHPLANRVAAWSEWSGSWNTVNIAVAAWKNYRLDETVVLDDAKRADVDAFHRENDLPEVHWGDAGGTDIRLVLRQYIDAWRMAGQEVILLDAVAVGISMSISLQLEEHYFQSEIRHAVDQALAAGTQGFFAPGRLQFGEDLHLSDIYEVLMALDGVKAVCMNRFKRVGSQYPDVSDAGFIELDGLEIAVCEQLAARPERGYYRLRLHGGRKG